MKPLQLASLRLKPLKTVGRVPEQPVESSVTIRHAHGSTEHRDSTLLRPCVSPLLPPHHHPVLVYRIGSFVRPPLCAWQPELRLLSFSSMQRAHAKAYATASSPRSFATLPDASSEAHAPRPGHWRVPPVGPYAMPTRTQPANHPRPRSARRHWRRWRRRGSPLRHARGATLLLELGEGVRLLFPCERRGHAHTRDERAVGRP